MPSAAAGGQIAQGILHALQAAVQIGVHERPEAPRAWASSDAGTTENKWPGHAQPRVTGETGDLPACPACVRACSTASVCDGRLRAVVQRAADDLTGEGAGMLAVFQQPHAIDDDMIDP